MSSLEGDGEKELSNNFHPAIIIDDDLFDFFLRGHERVDLPQQ